MTARFGAVRALGRQTYRLLALVIATTAAVLTALGDSGAAAAAVPAYSQVAINSPVPEATTFQGFGVSLAGAGDTDGEGIPEIVTSDASETAGGAVQGGLAWIIDGQTDQVLKTLAPPAPQAGEAFGKAVIDIGVVNGVNEVAVGAPGVNVDYNTGGICTTSTTTCLMQQGQVYVFNAATGALLFTINDPATQAVGAEFGRIYMAAPGDLNGDGIPDLIVTAPGEDAGPLVGAGEAFAFSGKDGSLLYKVKNPNPEMGASFGGGLSVPGDLNGDGVNDIVIGAPGATGDGQAGEGRAYVIDGKTGTLIRTLDDPTAQPPGPFSGASFGSDLGSNGAPGDINGDGVPDIYVAATEQNVGGDMNAGQAFIFSGKDGSLLRTIDSPAQQTNAGFGWAFAGAGDVNGDGLQDLLVGQFSSGDPNGYSSGAWVLDGRTGGVLASFPGTPFGPGDTLAAPGDVNGDGCSDYFIGGPSMNVGANNFQGQIIGELSHVNPGCRPSSTTVSCAPGSVAPRAATTCTVTVSDSGGAPESSPAGAVRVATSQSGSFTPAASCTLAATSTSGQSACQVTYTPAAVGSGKHAITASYPGDANHGASAGSATVTVAALVAPTVRGFHLTHKRFAITSRSTATTGVAARAPKGTTFVYTLSEAASVKIVIARMLSRQRRAKQGVLARRSRRGVNTVAFSGRIGSHALKPGRYRATLTATASGKASKAVTITFTVVRR